MASHLLIHLAQNGATLRKVTYLDPKTGNPRQVLTGQAYALMLALCDHANETERATWCSQRTYMAQTGLNGQTIQKILQQFIEAGWIRRDGQEPSRTGRPSDRYIVTLPELPALETRTAKPSSKVAPTNAPDFAPDFAPTFAPTNALTGKYLTRTETETKNTHTDKPSAQAAPSLLLKQLGVEYAKHELLQAKKAGAKILSEGAWLKSVTNDLTEPAGSKHSLALEVVELYGDSNTLPQLLAIMHDNERLTDQRTTAPAAKLPQHIDSALSSAIGIARVDGIEASKEWLASRPEQTEVLPLLLSWWDTLHPQRPATQRPQGVSSA
jgi:hypothetical protein